PAISKATMSSPPGALRAGQHLEPFAQERGHVGVVEGVAELVQEQAVFGVVVPAASSGAREVDLRAQAELRLGREVLRQKIPVLDHSNALVGKRNVQLCRSRLLHVPR